MRTSRPSHKDNSDCLKSPAFQGASMVGVESVVCLPVLPPSNLPFQRLSP